MRASMAKMTAIFAQATLGFMRRNGELFVTGRIKGPDHWLAAATSIRKTSRPAWLAAPDPSLTAAAVALLSTR